MAVMASFTPAVNYKALKAAKKAVKNEFLHRDTRKPSAEVLDAINEIIPAKRYQKLDRTGQKHIRDEMFKRSRLGELPKFTRQWYKDAKRYSATVLEMIDLYNTDLYRPGALDFKLLKKLKLGNFTQDSKAVRLTQHYRSKSGTKKSVAEKGDKLPHLFN